MTSRTLAARCWTTFSVTAKARALSGTSNIELAVQKHTVEVVTSDLQPFWIS
jgi:hypothetical protein